MENKEYYMKQAIKEAEKAYKKLEVPVGAIIVKDGRIIARAHNIKELKKIQFNICCQSKKHWKRLTL